MHPFFTAFFSQTAPDAPGCLGGPMGMPLMLLLMFGVFYFVLWRPQAKERKKQQDMLQKIQKGHDVVTQSGFYGKIVQVEDQAVLLDLGGGVKVRMLRAYIARNLTLEEEDKQAKALAKGGKPEAKK